MARVWARLAIDTGRHSIATNVRVPSDLGLHIGAGEGSGRRESNPHDQLGRLACCVSGQVIHRSAGTAMARERPSWHVVYRSIGHVTGTLTVPQVAWRMLVNRGIRRQSRRGPRLGHR
jgi:hypothetical protein